MEKTCFLFGHRDAPEALKAQIIEAVERQYLELGIRTFVVGGYGSFDLMAAGAVKAVKARHPDLTLLLLIPYHPAERPMELTPGFDGSFYPDGMESVPRRVAIVQANRKMLKLAESVICYVRYPGNTAALLELAQKRARAGELVLQNLAEVQRETRI